MIGLPRPGKKLLRSSLRKADERLGFASVGKVALSKIFPDHWSFMLGEIALYSFMILVVTGVYLTFFFEPSSALRVYHGHYTPLDGQSVSGAFASTVEISWDVRGGLVIRQAHHWAAHVFIGAIVLHLCRIYFTGMFRKPREINWFIGVTMLVLAIFNAFAGYSLPDDLLSGTGLHIFYTVEEAVPWLGDWLAFLTFGGPFPGRYIIERLYPLHIFVVPALLAMLITVHLGILIRQKHSHFAGPGRRDANVVGSRMWPSYGLRSMALLFAVAAVCMLAGGLAQINPVWVWGDFKSSTITSPSVADWYIAWIEGALRLWPPTEFHVLGFTVPTQFWPAIVLPGVTFGLLWLWPWLDRRITHDRGTHHITGRPREAPLRTAIGMTALTFYGLLLLASGEELLVEWSRWPIGTIRAILRVAVVALPVLVGGATYWIATSLLRSKAEGALYLSAAQLRPRHGEQKLEREEHVEKEERKSGPVPAAGVRPYEPAERPDAEVGNGGPEESDVDGRSLSEETFWLKRRAKERR